MKRGEIWFADTPSGDRPTMLMKQQLNLQV